MNTIYLLLRIEKAIQTRVRKSKHKITEPCSKEAANGSRGLSVKHPPMNDIIGAIVMMTQSLMTVLWERRNPTETNQSINNN